MADEALLRVEHLVKHFPVRKGLFAREVGAVRAVDDVSFAAYPGKTLCLVGESGSGKTTVGRSILRLIEPSAGKIVFNGVDVGSLEPKALRKIRKDMQIIFQDPFSSLNPRLTVSNMLTEIFNTHNVAPRSQYRDKVAELLGLVGLPLAAADRYPHEFSGGQRQRIGIARALAVEPRLIVADEPVSALDVSIQAQVLNLMMDLQEKLGLSYLFIGHDLSVVRHIADQVAVMYLGRIVEMGSTEDIFERPIHPYTRGLLSAIPLPEPGRRRQRVALRGDIPNPINPPTGCHFHPRCPDAVADCAQREQILVEISPGHRVACSVHAPSKPAE